MAIGLAMAIVRLQSGGGEERGKAVSTPGGIVISDTALVDNH